MKVDFLPVQWTTLYPWFWNSEFRVVVVVVVVVVAFYYSFL